MKLYIFLLLFLAHVVVYGQGAEKDSSGVLFAKIDFQEKFKCDTVSFWINKQMVFNAVCATSHPILDYTGMNVKVFRHGDKHLMLMHSGEKKLVQWEEPLLKLEVMVNKTKSSFYVDCNTAKAIGIYKASGDSVTFRYHDRWFTYE